MDPRDLLLVEGVRRFVALQEPDDEGIREHQDDALTIICRGNAVTVYLKPHEDPVLLVTSKGTLVYVEENAREYLIDRFA